MAYEIVNYAGYIFDIYKYILIFTVISSWIPPLYHSKIGNIGRKMTEPYLNLFRKIIPPIGGLDVSPILAFFLLGYIKIFFVQGLQVIIKMFN